MFAPTPKKALLFKAGMKWDIENLFQESLVFQHGVWGFSGIILAGGKNSRMHGVDKGFVKVNGRAIILRILDIFKDIFEDIWIITNNPENYSLLKEKRVFVVKDLIRGRGPLAGIYTGLMHMKNPAGFFVACDMPNLHIDLIKRQIRIFQKERYECLVPVYKDSAEPLHAIYTKPLAGRIYHFIKGKFYARRGMGINEFFKKCNCRFIEIREEEMGSFANLNTIDDIKEFRKNGSKIKSLG